MSTHAHHEAFPGFDPDRILHDGCPECEHRGEVDGGLDAIIHLDPVRFAEAWARAAAWQRDQLDPRRPIAACEAPMLKVLWTIQLMFERAGIAPLGVLPAPASNRYGRTGRGLPPEIAVDLDRAVDEINAVLAILEPGIQVGFDATPVGRPEASPAGEMRERDVPCQTCRRRQTWNWSAVCDYCKAR